MYSIAPGVSWRTIGKEVYVLHRCDNAVYCLNPTAACIWRGIKEHKKTESIVAELAERFDVEPAQARADVEELARLLKEKELITAP